MLHLQSSVHLHKVELIISGIEYKLDSTRIDISNSSCSLDSSITNLFAYLLRYLRWCLLNDLLMTSLHRAVTLIQVDVVAVSVTEDLELDVSRLLDVLLNYNVLVVETLQSFSLGSIELVMEFFLMANDTHALATTSQGGLDDHWETDLLGF